MDLRTEWNEEFGRELEVKNGYFSIPPGVACAINDYYRGNSGAVYAVGKITYCSSIVTVSTGFTGHKEGPDNAPDHEEIRERQERLISCMDQWKTIPLSYVKDPFDYYSFREGNGTMLYVKCADVRAGNGSNGCIMGIGWHGTEGPKKSFLTAGAMLYAFGRLNAQKDRVLYEACCNCLPYEAGLGDPNAYDEIINKAMVTSC